jgi:photosystem II stability/assembly factor-like uncharacterized protein
MLGVTQAGNRHVAVGERGLILLSDDAGRTWRQAPVPVSVTLTAVQFAAPQRGWAVGHGGVILRSDDGGESWHRSLDGRTAARLALEEAQALPESDPTRRRAELLVKDGPDKPFLAVHFLDATTGFATGAFGLVFRTTDGGASWAPWMAHVDNPEGSHIYAVAAADDGRLYMAGERGLFLVSSDGGQRFERLELAYDGTFFSLAIDDAGRIAVGGLRGNLFIARPERNGAMAWRKIDGLPEASVNALRWTDGHRLMLATQTGRLFVVGADDARATALPVPPSPPVSAMAPTVDAGLLTAGVAGLSLIAAPDGRN